MTKRTLTYIAFVLTRRNLLWCVGVLAAVCNPAAAQIDTLHLSLPEMIGKRGITYKYPVYSLDSLQSIDSVYAGEFTVEQDEAFVVDIIGIDADSTILSSAANVYYYSATQKIAFAHSEPVTGKGVLFYLLVKFRENAFGERSITLVNTLINEARQWDPVVDVIPGSLRPKDIFIDPKDPPQDRVVGDTLDFSVTGNVTLPLTWAVSDTHVASIDTNGTLIGKNVGQIIVSVTDADGLTDQSNLLPIHPKSLRSLTVSVPLDTSIMQNLVFKYPIRISDVTSLGISSAQFTIGFDQSVLIPQGIITDSTLTNFWTPAVNYKSGSVDVALAGTDTLTGSGVLAFVQFKVVRNAQTFFSTDVTLDNVLFNENINATIVDGKFKADPGPLITITNFPFGIIRNEVAQLTAVGGTAPYQWYVQTDTSVAVVDSNGLLTTKKSGFLKVTVFDANGFDKSDSTYVGDARIIFPDTSFIYTDTIDVPVAVTDLSGLEILSGQMKFNYDSTKLRLIDILQSETITSAIEMEYRDSAGQVVAAFSGSSYLAGSGVLLKLKFISTGAASIGFNQVLMASEVFFNEPGPTYRYVEQKTGKVAVLTKPNTPPVFTQKLTNATIREDSLFTFQLKAFDADGDTLIFGLYNRPANMNFDSIQGIITWKPAFTQANVYKINYDVGDFHPDGVVKDSATITVLETNRPPVFTQFMTNTTIINEDQLFTFDINAIDPDSDIVRYYIGNIQPEMSIDTVTGMFSWKPAFTQSGTFSITQIANDGKGGFANQPVTITVNNVNRPPIFTKTMPDTFIQSGQSIQYTYQASDPDGTPVSFSLIDFPADAEITAAGVFSWTTQPDQSGTFRIVVAAGDGGVTVRDTAFIFVNQSNMPPVFTNILRDTTIAENQTLTFTYQATDPENDTLVWAFLSVPPAGMKITTAGVLTWTPSFTQAGSYQVVVGVSDKSFSISDTALITVANTNLPPDFTAVLPDTTIYADSLFSFLYQGSDPDGDSVSIALIQFPIGAAMTPNGMVMWVPQQVGKDTFIVSLSDGALTAVDTAIVTVTGFPKLQTALFEIDFGTTIFGSLPTAEITIKNVGVVPLVLNRMQGLPGGNNFSVDAAQQLTVNVQEEKVLTFTYTPENIGTHIGTIAYQTNDPKQPLLGVLLKGTSISKSALKKKILVDVAHNSAIPLRDSLTGMAQLFSALKNSGISVSFAETTLTPTGYDAVLIVTPQKDFSAAERTVLHQFVSGGGLVVMMGEGMDTTGNTILNKFLTDTLWSTGLSVMNTLATDSTNNYLQNPQFPVISQFADTAHPYLRSIDSLVLFGSASVLAAGNGIPFAQFTNPSIAITGGGVKQAAIGLSEIGKGKLIVFGDATTWLNGSFTQGSFNIDAHDNLAFALNVFSVTEDYQVNLPAPTPNERYQLVSIPFDLDNTDIASVLKDLGGINPLVWRLFGHYTPAAGYAEFPSDGFNAFRRGEAYWLITRGQFNLNFGSATITPAQDFFPLTIGPGYSMIGNPFPYKVSWKNSRKGDSVQTTIYRFNPAINDFAAESQILEPFTGYFVKNLSQDSVTIFINPLDVSSLPKQMHSLSFNQDEWRISVGASSGKANDKENYAGVSSAAHAELDMLDAAEPPATPSGFVTVRFTNHSWKRHRGSYAVDIRPIAEEGEFWDFDVTAAKKQSHVSLSFVSLGNLPSDFEVYVIDKQSEVAQQIVNAGGYEFTMAKNETRRMFRLVVGKNSFVKENTGGIPLVPQDFALRQNYPNPFNPTTVIQYTLGHSGDVSVAIYNILGQRVRTLKKEFQSIGTYSIDWDGKDETGNIVASGVYFYKITVMSNGDRLFAETKKMVLMK